MSGSLQLPKCLQAAAVLLMATGVKKAELPAHPLGKLGAEKGLITFELLSKKF